MSANTRSVLVIGATGRSGQAVLNALQAQASKPAVHAFARAPEKLPAGIAQKCASVIKGDATDAAAVHRALDAARATDAVMCIGNPQVSANTDVRAVTARALADAVTVRAAAGAPTRVVVESSVGAGGSSITLGLGMGKLMAMYLHKVLKDHDEQERVLRAAFEKAPGDLLIVHPTGLADGAATGKIRVYEEGEKVKPTINRADVAAWIGGQICGSGDCFGKAVILSSA